MQNDNERPDRVAGSSGAPTHRLAAFAATRTRNPPVLPPLTSLEFGQSKFSLDTAVSTFCFYFAVIFDVICNCEPQDEHPVLEANEAPISPTKSHRLSWWPRGRHHEDSGDGAPSNPVVNELEDGPQGVPGCFGCLPPSSKRHEDAHKVRGFPAFFGHITAVQTECGPDREYVAATENNEEEAATGLGTSRRPSHREV